jgi:hypothetical protein
MFLHRRFASRRPIFAILILLCAIPALAQEFPHPPEEERPPSEHEGNPAEDANGLKELAGSSHIDRALPAELLRNIYSTHPTMLQWEETRDSSGHPSWTATPQTSGQASPIDLKGVDDMLSKGHTIVNTGKMPPGRMWRDLNTKYPGQIVTHEPESANRDPQKISDALALGNLPLDPATVKVFNALPQEKGMLEYFTEQSRMGIGGTLKDWQTINEQIKEKSGAKGLPHEVMPPTATKKAFLDELRYGTSSVVILYAHFDGLKLYMPGAHGGTVSIDEIAQIDRTGDPRVRNRVIILAACSAGARLEDPRSLTSVLLEKGIARTVMATDRPYDARQIPDLLARLGNRTALRKAGGQLQQYVELRAPALATLGNPPV